MDLEEDTLQEHLLQSYDPSPSSTQILYKLLLHALLTKDFRSFRNTVEHSLQKQPPTLNVNHVYSNHCEDTCLDIACRNALAEFVEFLLRKGAKPNRVNEAHNRAPIHFATESGNVNTLTALLTEPTVNLNLEAGQQTALHIAVRKKDLACAELLLEKGASANIPNSKGLTALHLAAMKGQRDMIELILEKCRQCPDLDSYKDYKNQTTREVIQQKFPDVPLPPKYDREVNVHDLKYYLIANDEMNFLKSLDVIKAEVLHDLADDLLEMAVQRNFHRSVTGILHKLKGNMINVKKAAQAAIEQGHYHILRELLIIEPDIANELVLNACSELGMAGKKGIDNMSDKLECLKLILEQDNVDVRCDDNKGNTPLHYAARAGCREAVTLLLDRGSYIGHMNKFNVPPIADIPMSTLSHYFDDCLQMRKERTNDYMIEFNYHCLMSQDNYAKQTKTRQDLREMEVFQYIMKNNGLKELLRHPLLSSFLYLKWHRIRYLLYAKFILYVTFYLFVNAYILGTTYNNPTSENKTEIIMNSSEVIGESKLKIALYHENTLWILTSIMLILLCIREILQFISSPWYYILNFENWLEIALIVLTFSVLIGAGPQVGAAVILLSAWKLVVLISQHPRMSTGIEMFRKVSFNFMRFLFPYAFLILAFALAFYTLFKDGNADNFSNPGYSFFKTIIMLTGEFDASDIPFVYHPVWSHIIFMLFVFLIAIVLFNLLNGLAVSDTAEILSKAELVGLISRISLLVYIENIAVGAPFRRRFCCNSSRWLRWNPFAFLVKRIFLFPSYLRDGKISVKLYDGLDTYKNDRHYDKYIYGGSFNRDKRWATLRMDPNIIKQAKQIISHKNQLSDNEKIMITLNKLQDKLATVEITLNIIKLAVENNNLNNAMESMRESQ